MPNESITAWLDVAQKRHDESWPREPWRTDLPRALAALRAVVELHAAYRVTRRISRCKECDEAWPGCPTIRAITAALNPEEAKP